MNSRLTLLLIVITTFLSTQARAIHETIQTETNDGMPVRISDFPFKEAPVEINLPEGFRYIDEKDSKEILINAGNDSASVKKVIGIIVPDTALQNYPSWILTYDVIGHVQDNRASTEDFSWVLDDTRDSDGNSNEQFRALAYYSKKIVTDTIEGKTPLLFWNNSVASQANQTVTE